MKIAVSVINLCLRFTRELTHGLQLDKSFTMLFLNKAYDFENIIVADFTSEGIQSRLQETLYIRKMYKILYKLPKLNVIVGILRANI